MAAAKAFPQAENRKAHRTIYIAPASEFIRHSANQLYRIREPLAAPDPLSSIGYSPIPLGIFLPSPPNLNSLSWKGGLSERVL